MDTGYVIHNLESCYYQGVVNGVIAICDRVGISYMDAVNTAICSC